MCVSCKKSTTGKCYACKRIDRFLSWVSGSTDVLPETDKQRGKLAARWLRQKFFASRGNACERCGWSVWHNGLPLLHICHKDDNFKNMSYDNLEALCPNCHAIWTYKISDLKFDGSSNGRYVNNIG